MTSIINGKEIAEKIKKDISAQIATLNSAPVLAVILIGNDPASRLYVKLKKKACEEIGIKSEVYLMDSEASENDIINKIHELNLRDDVNGILVQLPLPSQNQDRVIFEINPIKDVDGFHPESLKKIEAGEDWFLPPTAVGIIKLIQSTGEPIKNKIASIVSSQIFAKPISRMLYELGAAAVSAAAPDAPNLATITKAADILIVAAGIPNLITSDFVKKGAVVIDVGTTKVNDKIVGDIDRASVDQTAGYVSPVPGGVGPMTVACLLSNVLKAYRLQKQPRQSKTETTNF